MFSAIEQASGAICLVTGAAYGVGLATSRMLAEAGAHVLMVDDDRASGDAAISQIKRTVSGAMVSFIQTDLASQREVRALVDRIMSRYPRLDIVASCVDGCFAHRTETVDGLELTLALNHLGPYLMLRLLSDVLRASAPARVITLSSDAHRRGVINYEDIQSRLGYSALEAYAQAKLASLMTTYEFARRLQGTGVTLNAVDTGRHPCPSPARHSSLSRRLLSLVTQTPERVARTVARLATSPEVGAVTGTHFSHDEPRKSSATSLDTGEMRKVWQISADLTGLPVYP